MQRHVHGILHIHKVALLAAVGVFRFIALEKPDLPGRANLLVGFANQAAHVALMVFVRAENIEILDADNVGEDVFASGVEIEKLLGIAVEVQRAEVAEVLVLVIHASGTVAVGGCRGSVDKPRILGQRPMAESFGIRVIVLKNISGIGHRRGGAGAEMENRVKVPEVIRLLKDSLEK